MAVFVNKTRDVTICRLYIEGHTLQGIGDVYGLSRQRVKQILLANGVTIKTRVKKRTERHKFLGLNVPEPIKQAVVQEAERRQMSVSKFASKGLIDLLILVGRRDFTVQDLPEAKR